MQVGLDLAVAETEDSIRLYLWDCAFQLRPSSA